MEDLHACTRERNHDANFQSYPAEYTEEWWVYVDVVVVVDSSCEFYMHVFYYSRD